jgi:hypothetical protein
MSKEAMLFVFGKNGVIIACTKSVRECVIGMHFAQHMQLIARRLMF